MLAEARFREAHIRPSLMTIRLPQIEAFVLSHLSASPVAGAIAVLTAEKRTAVGKQVKAALQHEREGVADRVSVCTRRRARRSTNR
jgi:hypothetical protein